jgi:hypothetical protein
MDKKERIQMLKAMEIIMRNLNDEDLILTWLTDGIPDGTPIDDDEAFEDFTDDVTFADIMDTFVYIMGKACPESEIANERKGTLYCDGVVNEMSF